MYSKPWNFLRTNALFSEINNTIQSIDSSLRYKKLLFKIIGSPTTTISWQKDKAGRYNFLYVIELGRLAEIHNGKRKVITNTTDV